jgi:hypothetical protein
LLHITSHEANKSCSINYIKEWALLTFGPLVADKTS